MTTAREEAGKEEVDEEEANDCGNDEEMLTEAEGIGGHRRASLLGTGGGNACVVM